MVRRASEYVKSRGDEFAEVAHSMQTPLAILKSELFFLKQEAPENGRAVMCDRLIDGISKSLNAYLHLSRLEHVVRTEKKESVSLAEIVRECVEHVRVLSNVREIDIRTVLDPDTHIEGFPEKLRELVVNVLSNAIKYMGSGGRRRIITTVRRVHAYVCLVIEDTGIGIPKRDLKNICALFYRGTNGCSGAMGAGIGLAMVKKIAEAHNASVRVTSAVGRGTRVAVRFPAATR